MVGLITAVTTLDYTSLFTNVQAEAVGALTAVAPLGVIVLGATLGVKYGKRIFRAVAG